MKVGAKVEVNLTVEDMQKLKQHLDDEFISFAVFVRKAVRKRLRDELEIEVLKRGASDV